MGVSCIDPSTFDPAKLFKVTGMVAVVTGAGSGIGRSIALTLALNGAARVYLLGRRLEKLQETAELLGPAQAATKTMRPLQVDVTRKDQLAAAAAQVAAETGFVHLVVANAGILGPDPLCTGVANQSPQQLKEYIINTWSEEDCVKPFKTNAIGAFFTCIAFLDLLDKGNNNANQLEGITSQVIVNSSVAAYMKLATGGGGITYSSSKAAVSHMFKALSNLFVCYRIRVNLLHPGIFLSELGAGVDDCDGCPYTPDSIPAKRFGEEADLAGATLYLVSRAGAYLNGISLVVDGGMLAMLPSSC